MKYRILFFFAIGLPAAASAQQDKKAIHQGNELYRQQKYAEAEALYKQSLEQTAESLEGNYNLGAAWYKQQKLDDAVKKFTDIAAAASDKGVKAKAYHNLGNALFGSQKLEESIEAYKKALMNNPKDDETRYNLAYAQEKLKQQQQQNQDNKDQDKDNKDQDKEQGEKNKDDQQNKQDQDKKDQHKKDQDQENGDKGSDRDGQQPRPGQLSREDAERLLEAMSQEEKNTQDKLKNKKAAAGKGKVLKQW